MGQARVKKSLTPNGNQTEPKRGQGGAVSLTPPTVNTGRGGDSQQRGQGEPFGAERCRINTTLPQGIYQSLEIIARVTGKTLSQVALAAIEDGLIAQGNKARNVRQTLKDGE